MYGEIVMEEDAKLDQISIEKREEVEVKKLKYIGVWVFCIQAFYFSFLINNFFRDDVLAPAWLLVIYWITGLGSFASLFYFYRKKANIKLMKFLFIFAQIRTYMSLIHNGKIISEDEVRIKVLNK